MATTVSAFNDMMQQFLDELVLTFPEEKSFVKFQTSFSLLRKTRPRLVLENYMKSIGPVASQLMAKDEKYFKEHADDIPILKELNLMKIWTDDLSDNTKEAIWKYLHTMYILATTISAPRRALMACAGFAASSSGSAFSSTYAFFGCANRLAA